MALLATSSERASPEAAPPLRERAHAHTVANQSYVPVRRARRRATRRRRGIQGLPLVDRPEEEPRFQDPRLKTCDDDHFKKMKNRSMFYCGM